MSFQDRIQKSNGSCHNPKNRAEIKQQKENSAECSVLRNTDHAFLLNTQHSQLSTHMISDKDLLSRQQARQLAQKAKDASRILADFSQAKIDAVVDAIAEAADKEAEVLAKMAHEETT